MVLTDVSRRVAPAPPSAMPAAAPAPPGRRFASRVSTVAVAFMAVESVLGLLVHDLYREDRWAVAALRGNDLVTLVLVVPVLGLALVRSRTSAGWTLVWLAGLFYGVYNFAYYVFGTAFNDVFLLHEATLVLSLSALVSLAVTVDPASLAGAVRAGGHRVVASFMVVVGSALVAAWGGFSLRFAIDGTLPKDVMPPNAVHLVYALDLALLAPAFLAGGILLWRGTAWGRVLAAVVNLFGAAYLVVLEFVGGFEADAGIAGKTWMSPPSILGAVACAAAAIALLRGGHGEERS